MFSCLKDFYKNSQKLLTLCVLIFFYEMLFDFGGNRSRFMYKLLVGFFSLFKMFLKISKAFHVFKGHIRSLLCLIPSDLFNPNICFYGQHLSLFTLVITLFVKRRETIN